jgi:iron complex outermembrane receptor protein
MKNLLFSTCLLIGIFDVLSQEKVVDSLSVETLEEVLVRSVRVAADSPITHSNLGKEELEERNLGQDIPYMLSFLPSVVTTSDAGAGIGYTYIRVRGSDASRVNVTLNGIPFNDAESQGTFFVNLPDFTSSVQNLQLQRGVGTSTNGSGAFGASLNILTDGVSKIPGGEIANSIGSFNSRKHTLKFSTGLIKDRIEIAGRLSAIKSDGYIDRASSDLKSYLLQGVFVSKNTLIKAISFSGKEVTYQAWNGIDAETLKSDRTFNPSGMYTDEEGNIKFYDNEVDNYTQDHYQLFWNQQYDAKWSSNVSLNYTYGRGYFEQYKGDQSFEDYGFRPVEIGGETISTTDLVRRRWLNNNFYAANASLNYKTNRFDINLGGFYSYYGGDHFGEVIWAQNAGSSEIRDRYYSGNGDKNEFTVFGKATFRINDQWSVFGDLQGRFVSYRIGGLTSERIPLTVKEKYDFFNPKAGVSYKLNTTDQFYFSYGRANREPRRSDYEQGIFTSEKLDDFELGWRKAFEASRLNINLFYMNYQDQLVLTGAIDDVGAPVRATSGKSYRLGIEIDADLWVSEKIKLQPNLALSSNKNVEFIASQNGDLVDLGNTNTAFSPGIIAGNSIVYQPVKGLQLILLSKYVGEQFMGNIDSETSKLESYFIHDFNLQYTLEQVPWVKSIVFSGLVNNIFNKKYVSNGYFYTFDDDYSVPGEITSIEGAGYYPQAEINFLTGITLKF